MYSIFYIESQNILQIFCKKKKRIKKIMVTCIYSTKFLKKFFRNLSNVKKV